MLVQWDDRRAIEVLLQRILMEVAREDRGGWSDRDHADVPPAVLLLLAYARRSRLGTVPAGRVTAVMEETATLLAGRDLPPHLFGGFPHLAWALEHAAAVIGDDGYDLTEVDDALQHYLAHDPWTYHFDLIAGLAGLGVYAAERRDRETGRSLLASVVRRLAGMARQVDGGITWFTPPTLLPAWQREFAPRGYYNLGVAHGVPGVIAVLATAVDRDAEGETAERLLAGAMTWIEGQRLDDDSPSVFPAMVVPGRQEPPARLAWCYGDAGVAVALLRAARLAGRRDWEETAVAVAHRAARRPEASAGVVDAPLCHGSAGLVRIFHRLWRATGEKIFADAARRWLADLLERYRREGLAGLVLYREHGSTVHHDLLNGLPGIGLTLLSLLDDSVGDWDRILLLDLPVPVTAEQMS